MFYHLNLSIECDKEASHIYVINFKLLCSIASGILTDSKVNRFIYNVVIYKLRLYYLKNINKTFSNYFLNKNSTTINYIKNKIFKRKQTNKMSKNKRIRVDEIDIEDTIDYEMLSSIMDTESNEKEPEKNTNVNVPKSKEKEKETVTNISTTVDGIRYKEARTCKEFYEENLLIPEQYFEIILEQKPDDKVKYYVSSYGTLELNILVNEIKDYVLEIDEIQEPKGKKN